MADRSVHGVIRQFLKCTTLHGFKYLNTGHRGDRIGWLLCCCASACSAGMLLFVLWQRFLQMPALLTLQDITSKDMTFQTFPMVAVCPSPDLIAQNVIDHLQTEHVQNSSRLPILLSRVLQGLPSGNDQLLTLQNFLSQNDVAMPQIFFERMPQCNQLITVCRLMDQVLPCDKLFQKELTKWGVCCVLRPNSVANRTELLKNVPQDQTLQMVLKCTNSSIPYNCIFFTQYDTEELLDKTVVKPGNNYLSTLTFSAVLDTHLDTLVQGSCAKGDTYTRYQCVARCIERQCGCYDILRAVDKEVSQHLPPCSIVKMDCLRTAVADESCNCLPSCKKVATVRVTETSSLTGVEHTLDPLITGINASQSAILYFRVKLYGSQVFSVNPTESWVTLLSSLGGVFNMFIGVGVFSALEFLFLLIRLPVAMAKSTSEFHAPYIH